MRPRPRQPVGVRTRPRRLNASPVLRLAAKMAEHALATEMAVRSGYARGPTASRRWESTTPEAMRRVGGWGADTSPSHAHRTRRHEALTTATPRRMSTPGCLLLEPRQEFAPGQRLAERLGQWTRHTRCDPEPPRILRRYRRPHNRVRRPARSRHRTPPHPGSPVRELTGKVPDRDRTSSQPRTCPRRVTTLTTQGPECKSPAQLTRVGSRAAILTVAQRRLQEAYSARYRQPPRPQRGPLPALSPHGPAGRDGPGIQAVRRAGL